MNTIAEKWDGYAADVVPKNAPKVQISETRQAFYAGAAAILGIMAGLGENTSEDAGAAILAGLHDEIRMFMKTITERG